MLGRLPFAAPDAIPCCWASAHDLGQCTCWLTVVAPHPTQRVQEGPNAIRSGRCGDCAYRRDSPERRELDGDELPYVDTQRFYCHDGTPKTIAYVHPSGAVQVPGRDSYEPILRDGRAWMADGRPALICAGWAQVDRAVQVRWERFGR
jgi:hypothetical protein